jgi:hypothetical protein
MDIIPPALIETGESDAAPEEKTPLQMASESRESASVAWVKYELEKHGKHCPALRNIRSLRAYLLIGIGFILSASMWGTVTIQASLRADRLELKDEFRSIIREEIGKVAIADPPIPSPLVYPPVTPAIVPATKPRRSSPATQASASVSPAGARFANPLHYLQAVQ